MGRLPWPIPDWRRFELAAYVSLAIGAPPDDRPAYQFNAKILVGGYQKARQVDLLVTFPSGRRLMVEVQKRSRRIGHEFIDAVEGKLTFVGVESAHLVSSAGFTGDAVERIRHSNGRIIASHVRSPGPEWSISSSASLILELADGNRHPIALRGRTILDPLSGNIRHLVLEGLDENTKTLAVAPILRRGPGQLDVRPWLIPNPGNLTGLRFEWVELTGETRSADLSPSTSSEHQATLG